MPDMHPTSRLALATLVCSTATAQATWSLLYPPTSPPPRYEAAMASLGEDGPVVLFSGRPPVIQPNAGFLQDAWLLQGNTWTPMPGPLPPAREGAAMAYDVRRNLLVLFGGFTIGSGLRGDTWLYDGNQWQPGPSGPSARRNHAMAYDPIHMTIVMFGGVVPGFPGGYPQDTWECSGGSWSQIPPQANGPSPRAWNLMAFDAVNGKVLLHGGALQSAVSGPQDILYNDTWLYDGQIHQWQQAQPASAPPPRIGGAIAADLERGRVIVHGGELANDYPWEWNGQNWSLRVEACPSARSKHSMAFDEPGHRLVMFGGVTNSGSPTTDLWAFGSQFPTTTARYGTGCSGSAGVPKLDNRLFSYPWIGETYTSEVQRVPQGSVPVFFATGFAATANSLAAVGMPGCSQYVAPLVSDLRIANNGRATWDLSIPNSTAMIGLQLYQQALVLSPGSNAAGVIASNGLDLRVGSR
ncbi:MAG: hypothetical protein H6838_09965 [Planctomycetes bacterium]|nr:hypothetical protein [Planctomycetota bacterium]MCB9885809.1 hypothetical protein [Planctomycetota bacterium]